MIMTNFEEEEILIIQVGRDASSHALDIERPKPSILAEGFQDSLSDTLILYFINDFFVIKNKRKGTVQGNRNFIPTKFK